MPTFTKNTTIDDILDEEQRVSLLVNLRPHTGLKIGDAANSRIVDTSGLESLLVAVRILMATGVRFTEPVNLRGKAPYGEGCTAEVKAVVKAARSNLGWSEEFDTVVKLELMTALFPQFADVTDKRSYKYPSLDKLLGLSTLKNLLKNDFFKLHHGAVSNADSAKPIIDRNKTPVHLYKRNETSGHSLEEGMQQKVFELKIRPSQEPIGCQPPCVQMLLLGGLKTDVPDFKRLTLVSRNAQLQMQTVRYCILMSIRKAVAGISQDRVRVYLPTGHEHVPPIDTESNTSSVRAPEAWSLTDGGQFILIYSICDTPEDVGAPEFNEFRAWRETVVQYQDSYGYRSAAHYAVQGTSARPDPFTTYRSTDVADAGDVTDQSMDLGDSGDEDPIKTHHSSPLHRYSPSPLHCYSPSPEETVQSGIIKSESGQVMEEDDSGDESSTNERGTEDEGSLSPIDVENKAKLDHEDEAKSENRPSEPLRTGFFDNVQWD